MQACCGLQIIGRIWLIVLQFELLYIFTWNPAAACTLWKGWKKVFLFCQLQFWGQAPYWQHGSDLISIRSSMLGPSIFCARVNPHAQQRSRPSTKAQWCNGVDAAAKKVAQGFFPLLATLSMDLSKPPDLWPTSSSCWPSHFWKTAPCNNTIPNPCLWVETEWQEGFSAWWAPWKGYVKEH